MTARLVLIVAHGADEHADAVQRELDRLDVPVCRISRESLPGAGLSWGLAHTVLNGSNVRGASGFWRRPAHPDVADIAPEMALFAYRESEDAFDGACLVSDIDWLSDPLAIQTAELKMRQVGVAAHLGIAVPPTLVTNVASDARDFAAEHGAVVAKPVRYGLVTEGPEPTVAWTTAVGDDDLADLEGTPVLLQKRIIARYHMRVVTVRDEVFVSRLEADELDWRARITNHDRFVRVPETDRRELAEAARLIAAKFSLGYTAQDWIIDTADRMWFLELNPSGQWLFVDPIHDGAITLAIAKHLASGPSQ